MAVAGRNEVTGLGQGMLDAQNRMAPEFISRVAALGTRADLSADDRKVISLFEQGVKRASESSQAS